MVVEKQLFVHSPRYVARVEALFFGWELIQEVFSGIRFLDYSFSFDEFLCFLFGINIFLVKVRFSIPIVKYNDEENKMRVMVLAGSRDSKNLRSSLGFFHQISGRWLWPFRSAFSTWPPPISGIDRG